MTVSGSGYIRLQRGTHTTESNQIVDSQELSDAYVRIRREKRWQMCSSNSASVVVIFGVGPL